MIERLNEAYRQIARETGVGLSRAESRLVSSKAKGRSDS